MGFLHVHSGPFTPQLLWWVLEHPCPPAAPPMAPFGGWLLVSSPTFVPWLWGTVAGIQSCHLLPSQVRQNLVPHLATLLVLLQIFRISEHRASPAGSEMVTCQETERTPVAFEAFPSSELLTNNCVLRSLEFRDFLKTALDKNPETRPSAAQLLEVGLRVCEPPVSVHRNSL